MACIQDGCGGRTEGWQRLATSPGPGPAPPPATAPATAAARPEATPCQAVVGSPTHGSADGSAGIAGAAPVHIAGAAVDLGTLSLAVSPAIVI